MVKRYPMFSRLIHNSRIISRKVYEASDINKNESLKQLNRRRKTHIRLLQPVKA